VSVSGFALFIFLALLLGFIIRRRLKQFFVGGKGVDGVKDVVMTSFLLAMWNRFDLYNQLHLIHLPKILRDSMSYVLAPFIIFTSFGAECAIPWKFKDGFWLTFGVLFFVFSIGMFQLCKRPPRYGCTTRSFYAVINRNMFFSFSVRRGIQIMLRKAIAATIRSSDSIDGKRRLYGEASTIIDEYPHKQIYDLSVCIIIASHLALFLPFPSRYEVSEFPELYREDPNQNLWLYDRDTNLNITNKEYYEYWSFVLDIAGCYALAIRADSNDVGSVIWLLFLDLIRCFFTFLGAEMIVKDSHIKDDFVTFPIFLPINLKSFAIYNISLFSFWFIIVDIYAITCSSTDFCLPGFSWILIFYFVIVSVIFISLSLPVIVNAFNKARGPESELVDLADPDSLEDFPILKSFRLAISKSISRLSKRNSKTSTNLTKGINSGNSTIIDPVINPVVIISNPISSTRNLTSSLSSTSSTLTSENPQPHVTPDIEDRLVARKREILLAFANSKAKSRDEESSKNKAKTHTAVTSTNSTKDLTLINSPDKLTKVRTLDTVADVSDANTFSTNSSATNTTNTAVIIATKEQDFKEVKSSSVDDSTIIVHAKDTDVLVHKSDNEGFTNNVDEIAVNETDLLKSSNHSENVFKVLDNKDMYENLLSLRMYMDTSSDITEAVSILRDYESNKFIKKDFYGRLLLHRACMTTSVNIDEVKHIFQEYPQAIQEKDQDGRLPLHLACLNECPEKNSLVRLLLERYADGAKCVDIDGRLPLHPHLSSMNSSEKLTVVQLLLDKYPLGSQSMDTNGSLPLHLACEYKADLDVVEFLLLKYEEGVKVQDKNGRLPLHLTHMSSSVVLSYKVRNKWRNAIDVKDIFGKIPADYDKTKIEIEHQFLAISQRLKSRGHHIRDNFLLQASQLGRLCKFVLICDDSSSMNKFVRPGPGAPPVDPLSADKPTRWTELRSTCEVVVELACAISESIDVHFLNHIGALKGIHTTEQFIAGFPAKPHGSVPLARAIRDVIAANKKLPKGKMLVILFATDGETDGGELEIAEVKEALATKPSWCKVQVLKITDNDDETSYLDEFDRAIEGVDVTDDYFSVLANVRKYRGQNTSFSFGDYLVKCLIGPLDKEIDEIDEPSRTT
jgi:ankyrin repeat protein